MGAVRAILFGGQIGEPIYRVDETGKPTFGSPEEDASLFREYHRKLVSLSEKLYTAPAKEIAASQQREMNAFFEALIAEVNRNYDLGGDILNRQIRT